MNITQAYREITQSRSFYQLEKFVLGQHHSPEMQYHQLVIEANGLQESIKETEISIKKLYAEAEELRETGKKSKQFEAELKEMQAEQKKLQIESNKKELGYLLTLFEKYPKYTREQIEMAQKDYWETRLTRVAQLQFLGSQTGVTWAQLDALQQANVIEEALSEIPTMSKIQNNLTELTIDRKEQND